MMAMPNLMQAGLRVKWRPDRDLNPGRSLDRAA